MAGRSQRHGSTYVVVGVPPLPRDVAALVDAQRAHDALVHVRLRARRWELVRRDVLEGVGAFVFANVLVIRGWVDLVVVVLVGALVGLV